MKPALLFFGLFAGLYATSLAQKPDAGKAAHPYLIITAGTTITAYFNDKPLPVETAEQFGGYVQANKKALVEAWVVVTGKPKTGTFDEVLKVLNRYRFKHVEKNIQKD